MTQRVMGFSQGFPASPLGLLALKALRESVKALHDTTDPVGGRLSRVIAYAGTRADYLDVRQDVAAVLDGWVKDDAADDLELVADVVLDATRAAMIRGMERRLSDPTYRNGLARALAGLYLP